MRKNVQRGDKLRRREISIVDEEMEEGLHRFDQRLRLLVAVDNHQQRLLRCLVQQCQVEGLRGRNQSGNRERSLFPAREPAQQILKRRLAARGLKQIPDCWMRHWLGCCAWSRACITSPAPTPFRQCSSWNSQARAVKP